MVWKSSNEKFIKKQGNDINYKQFVSKCSRAGKLIRSMLSRDYATLTQNSFDSFNSWNEHPLRNKG